MDRRHRGERGLGELRETALSQHADSLAEYLVERRHAPATVEAYLRAAAHFGRWLSSSTLPISRVCEQVVGRFLDEHLSRCHCPPPVLRHRNTNRAALRHLLEILQRKGIASRTVLPVPPNVHEELAEFDEYLQRVLGASEATRTCRRRYVRDFLEAAFGHDPIDLACLRPKDVTQFVLERGKGCKPGTVGVISSSLRSYFRFRRLSGDCPRSLSEAVPSVARWRLDSLPKGMTEAELNRFLDSFDGSEPRGLRDFAMAVCLVELGLRAAEVSALRLGDLDWHQGTLTIDPGKGRASSTLPMSRKVGQVLVEYLRRGRPPTDDRHVFVRHGVLEGQPIGPSVVRSAVRLAYRRAGLPSEWTGTHRLRHAAATRMVQRGASLKEVADVLRHRSLDTTAIYTKVDIARLRAVALPWPGRSS